MLDGLIVSRRAIMGNSWLVEEKTIRHYRLTNGLTCKVQNEFQKVRCPHCQQEQYSRLTHIWWYINTDGTYKLEYHTNYDSNLNNLKDLLISYGVNGASIKESEINGKWVLFEGAQVIGGEFKNKT